MNDTEFDELMRLDGARWRATRATGPALDAALAGLATAAAIDPVTRTEPATQLDPVTRAQPVARAEPTAWVSSTWTQRRRRTVPPIAAAAAVVVAATTVGILSAHRRSDSGRPVGPSTTAPVLSGSSRPVPSGYQQVSYHGITLNVPVSWKVRPVYCGQPQGDAVVPFTGQVASCPRSGTRTPDPAVTRHTVVLLGQSSDVHSVRNDLTTAVLVDGRSALRSGGSAAPADPIVLRIPSLDVAISVSAPSVAQAMTVLGTVHVTPVDDLGCQDRIVDAAPSGNAASATLVPDRPSSGVVCEYSFGEGSTSNSPYWLVGSRRLSGVELSALRSTFDSFTPAPSHSLDFPISWYRLTYAHGRTRIVAATVSYYPALATDGTRTYRGNLQGPELPDAFR